MAIFSETYIEGATNTQIIDFLTTLDNRIIKTDDTTVNIDGKFTLSINANLLCSITVNGVAHDGVSISRTDGVYVKSVIGENVIILRLADFYYRNQNQVAYITDETNYFGGIVSNSANILDVKFYRCSDGAGVYYLKQLIAFTPYEGSICYSSVAICNNGSSIFKIKGILSCSTVTLYSTLYFNGKTYVAIGTNHLVEISQ